MSYDIGVMNGRYFNYVAAFGLFTDVSYKTPQNVKNVLGHQAYVFESLKSLSNIKSYYLAIHCNEIEMKGSYIYGMISNSRSVGGVKDICGKDVELDDGLFEVTLVKEPVSPLELQQIVAGLLSKTRKALWLSALRRTGL